MSGNLLEYYRALWWVIEIITKTQKTNITKILLPRHTKKLLKMIFLIGIFLSAFLLFSFLFGNFSQKLLFNKIGLLRCSGMNGQNSDLV